MNTLDEIKRRLSESPKDTTWLENAKFRQANKEWLRYSQKIALKILQYLREHKITQAELAKNLDMSPQYVSKLLKGKQNLSLETIVKLQSATGLVLIKIPMSETERKNDRKQGIYSEIQLGYYNCVNDNNKALIAKYTQGSTISKNGSDLSKSLEKNA